MAESHAEWRHRVSEVPIGDVLIVADALEAPQQGGERVSGPAAVRCTACRVDRRHLKQGSPARSHICISDMYLNKRILETVKNPTRPLFGTSLELVSQ